LLDPIAKTKSLVVGALEKVGIPPQLRDFQAEWESPAVGLFRGAAFSTALLTHKYCYTAMFPFPIGTRAASNDAAGKNSAGSSEPKPGARDVQGESVWSSGATDWLAVATTESRVCGDG